MLTPMVPWSMCVKMSYLLSSTRSLNSLTCELDMAICKLFLLHHVCRRRGGLSMQRMFGFWWLLSTSMLGHEHLFNWWVQGCEKYLFHMLSHLEAGKVMVSLGSAVIGPISVFSRLREVELFFPKLSMYLCRERIGNFKTCGSWAYVILRGCPECLLTLFGGCCGF